MAAGYLYTMPHNQALSQSTGA